MAYSLFELVSPEIRNTFIAINFVPVFLALVGYLAGWANGRMRRSDYWTYGIFITIVATILLSQTVFAGIESLGNDVVIALRYFAVSYLILLVLYIIMFFLQVRRFHDAGLSGWWVVGLGVVGCIFSAIAYYVIRVSEGDVNPDLILLLFNSPVTIYYLIILCSDSEKGKNKWGMSKKYPTPVSFDSPNLLPA